MHGSNLPLSKWGIAIYLMTTSLKGVSSMKLHRDLGITQKSAWHLAHRIRKAWESEQGLFGGPVEVDETYVGGKWKGMGRGPKGKAIVAGVLDKPTNQVKTVVLPLTKKPVLQGFVLDNVELDATLHSDGHLSYRGIPLKHEAVDHATGELLGVRLRPTASRATGPCSSGASTGPTTTSAPSTYRGTPPSLRDGTTTVPGIPLTR